MEVAHILTSVGKVEDVDVLIAAILHDTVEDTDTTKEDIIEMFGENKIETAPYASVEKWNSGHSFCKLTDDLMNSQLPIELRQAVREHLGEDAFMQGSRQPRHYKDGRSPLS